MTTQQETPPAPMSTWRFVLALIGAERGRFLYNMLGFSTMMLSWLVPGWVSREFFNLISGDAPAMYSFWSLVAILVAATLGRMAGIFGTIKANVPFTYRIHTLLHKNMLGRILQLPGADALPEAPGATISRFRDDVNELPWFCLWFNNLVGNLLFAIVAVSLMASINLTMTLVAFTPLTIIVLAANAGTRRIEKYRDATRKTGGQVTAFIAETFGAAQAVQVARAEEQVVRHFAKLNEERRKAFANWCVDADMMAAAQPDALFMHCLPAHRGEEVTAEVIDGAQSVVWDEAENRMHVQRALMEYLLLGQQSA